MNTENEIRETPGLVKVMQNTENTTAEIKAVAADSQFVPRPVKAADPQSAARFKELVPTAFGFAVLFLLAIYKNEAGAAYTAMVAGMFALFKAVEDATRKLTLKAQRSDGSAPAAREASTTAPSAPASKEASTAVNRPYRLFLMIICILLSVSVWTTSSSTLQFLDRCLIQLLAAVWLLLGRFPAAGWGPGQYILGVLHVVCTPLAHLFVPFRDLANFAKQSKHANKSGARALPAILLGLAIACPILIFVLTLLSEADSVFAHLLNSITLNFTIPEFLQDCIPVLFDLVFAFILFYTLAHFFCGQGDPRIHIESGKRTANPLTAITVLDQSYELFTLQPLMSAREAVACEKIIQLHSMTKTYAVPGLRLGYVVAAAPVMECLRRYVRPWSVNTLAIEAGKWLTKHDVVAVPDIWGYLKETQRLRMRLNEIPGISVAPTDTCFMLAEIKGNTAADLKDYLIKEHRLLIRDASNFHGLTPRHFRISTQRPDENDLLVEAIREFISQADGEQTL